MWEKEYPKFFNFLVKDSCWKEEKVRTMMLEPILMVKSKIIMFHVLDTWSFKLAWSRE
jgi:hypothetical protein